MDTSAYPLLDITIAGSIATIILNRPASHNALNSELIASLTAAFRDLGARADLRAMVLRGAGPSFCAGGDIRMMRTSLDLSEAENLRDGVALATLFETINTAPMPTIAAVHGAALGGGVGLVATCDLVLATEETSFGFTEVRLGLIPATISPYVIAKIGVSQARALFLTGDRFDAARAEAIGLVHQVVAPDALDVALAKTVNRLRGNGPLAMRAAKALIAQVAGRPTDAVLHETAAKIARLRTSPEAQEGLTAFIEKRRASWAEEI